MPARLQKKVTKCGSVLKACRMQDRRGPVVLLILGIYFIACGILFGGISVIEIGTAGWISTAISSVIGVAMLLFRNVNVGNYLAYYQRQTGYSAEELRNADRELMSCYAVMIGDVTEQTGKKPVLMFIVTDHYFLSVGSIKGTYLRRLDDIVAAFYSCQIPQRGGYRQGLFVISRQDLQKKPSKNRMTKKWYGGYESGIMVWARDCEKLCQETLTEMTGRAPHIIPYQNIVVNGMQYNLMSLDNWQADWARIFGRY